MRKPQTINNIVHYPCTNSKVFFLIDIEMLPVLLRHNRKWFLDRQTGYAKTNSKLLLKLVTVSEALFGIHHDHADRNKLNNLKNNLRPATQSQNMMNRPKVHGTSPYKGVSWSKHAGKWRATIGINLRQIHLGYFSSEIDAAKAYNEAAKKHYGEFALLNRISVHS